MCDSTQVTVNQRGGRHRSLLVGLAAAIALVAPGCTSISATDTSAATTAEESTTTPDTHAGYVPPLAESKPTTVRVPSIGLEAPLLHLGLRPDGSLDVPPTEPGSPASWYDKSPTPGEIGPAILLGHVNDTSNQDGVFGRLDELRNGDHIEVTREDHSTATFEVTGYEQYSKDNFPTQKVYGNTSQAEIRLITCDGYDPLTGLWDENLVVYGRLI